MSLQTRPVFLGSCGGISKSAWFTTGFSTSSLPDYHVLCWDIFGLAVGNLALDVGGVKWGGYLYNETRGRELRIEIGLDGDGIRDTSSSNLVYCGQHLDGELYIRS